MVTVSLCMIVKNEEEVLARCLDSVKDLADEIVIVDTGSTDGTRETAGKYTDRVFSYPWHDDFAAARNFAFSKGTGDYLMWLDADDVISDENREKFKRLKEELDGETDVVMLPYETAFDKNGTPVFSYYRERLVKNGRGFRWVGAVHEVIVPSGKVIYGDAAVWHRKVKPGDGDRNLRIYEKMLANGQKLDARHAFYYARELKDHRLFEQAAKAFEEFLARPDGWVENQIDACRQLAVCRRALGDREGELTALFKSFFYDIPRAETLCEIGAWFMERARYETAAHWFKQALEVPMREKSGGLVVKDCYGYIPLLQICVCLDRMGQWELAREYNRLAGERKPGSEVCRNNEEYFKKRLDAAV